MFSRCVAAFVVATLLACPVARAQERVDLWRSYAEKLPPQALVVVHLRNGRSVRGNLIGLSDDCIVVLRKTRLPVPPVELAIADIDSIEPRKDEWSPGAKVLTGVGSVGAVILIILVIGLAHDVH